MHTVLALLAIPLLVLIMEVPFILLAFAPEASSYSPIQFLRSHIH